MSRPFFAPTTSEVSFSLVVRSIHDMFYYCSIVIFYPVVDVDSQYLYFHRSLQHRINSIFVWYHEPRIPRAYHTL
jgi:hypothetical protein